MRVSDGLIKPNIFDPLPARVLGPREVLFGEVQLDSAAQP